MTTVEPKDNSPDFNQEKLVNELRDEAQAKRLEAAIRSTEILGKAVDVLCKRITIGELSDNMLLRIVVSLTKSTAYFGGDARPRRRS